MNAQFGVKQDVKDVITADSPDIVHKPLLKTHSNKEEEEEEEPKRMKIVRRVIVREFPADGIPRERIYEKNNFTP